MVNALTDGNSAHPSSSASDQGTQHVASVLVPSPSSKGDGQKQKPNNGARPISKFPPVQIAMPFCKLCDSKEHYPSSCPKYDSIVMCKSRATELNVCHRCFRLGQQAKACKRPSKCIKCKGEHHIVFCPNMKS